MKKQQLCGLLILSVLIIVTPFSVSATQPPLPPEIEVLVSAQGYTPETELIIEQLTSSASLCGIKLNMIIMDYYDLIYKILYNDFEAVLFITAAWYQPDSFETIIWLLNFYFGSSSYLYYYNPEIKAKIDQLQALYYGGYLDESITLFHEIELMIYEGQYYPAIGYHYDSYLIHTHLLLINNAIVGPFSDIAIRFALSYLIDRELFISQMQTRYPYELVQTSHLFGWSQYHDLSLPEITYSIGKATSTLATAGYRPCRIF